MAALHSPPKKFDCIWWERESSVLVPSSAEPVPPTCFLEQNAINMCVTGENTEKVFKKILPVISGR